jgi:hypothetical protein
LAAWLTPGSRLPSISASAVGFSISASRTRFTSVATFNAGSVNAAPPVRFKTSLRTLSLLRRTEAARSILVACLLVLVPVSLGRKVNDRAPSVIASRTSTISVIARSPCLPVRRIPNGFSISLL